MAPLMSMAAAGTGAPTTARVVDPPMPLVPTTRTVGSLAAALGDVRRHGGAVTSETRTVPGIGSWAFVTDGDGREVVLWEHAGRHIAADPSRNR
jgi:predicted enzyme related to lactoylglutathione lyase